MEQFTEKWRAENKNMIFTFVGEGESYTPLGHDAGVTSRKIHQGVPDIHTTVFPAHTGMEEEVHENLSHVFYVLAGEITVLQQGRVQGILKCGDAVYIPAGEFHEVRNELEGDSMFLAVTYPE